MRSGSGPRWVSTVVVALVAVRVVVAAALVVGPWTDEPAELRGWDAERFQEIVQAPGLAYRDHEVEYPPGAVVLLEALAGDDAAQTQDRLVVLMLLADLGVAALLARRWSGSAAVAWLLLATPMLPGAYLRFDLVSVLLAVLAAAVVPRPGPSADRGSITRPWAAPVAGVLLVAATLVKTWPLVLAPGWLRSGRRAALGWASAAGVTAAGAWLLVAGVDGPAQVLGFRGAEGWHVESTPGLVTGLWSGEAAVLESGAFRLGHAQRRVSGLLLAVFVVGVALLWRRAAGAPAGRLAEVDRADALATLGATALLLVTAPLLSPQYLLWVLPWAAVLWPLGERRLVALVAGAVVLTAAVLGAVGPPGVDQPVPQVLLLVRNGLLAAVVVVAFRRLRRPPGPVSAAGVPTGAAAASSPGS